MENGIDLIVVSYNTADWTVACIRSLLRHTPEPRNIIVVDNGSTDDTLVRLQCLQPAVTLLAGDSNLGYARACNRGILCGRQPFIALLNSDVLATRGWVEPLIACLRSDPQIAVVGPKTVTRDGRITGAGVVGTLFDHAPRGYLQPDRPDLYAEQEDCFSVSGAAYVIRRDLLSELGLFDERYFFYFEETDYSVNARAHGYRVVYCPTSRIIHEGGQSNRDDGQLRRYFVDSRAHFLGKWAGTDGTTTA
ncbi:MAG: glycosyltransferase family 2 protein [Firmicutes bacterium]|nr:glycosyltransferase family 2 protein [Bacillota bacterium]